MSYVNREECQKMDCSGKCEEFDSCAECAEEYAEELKSKVGINAGMVYMKEFAVKTTNSKCYIAEVYVNDPSIEAASITKETKKILQQYVEDHEIPIKSMSSIDGYGFKRKPADSVVLREPTEYEIYVYFPMEKHLRFHGWK